MKVLIISFSYKPTVSPRAFRWSAIAEYWAKQGHYVDVVCGWKPGLLESEILNGVHVYRTGGQITEFLKSRFGIKNPSGEISHCGQRAAAAVSLRHEAASLVKQMHDHTWKKVYWPDHACLWYFSAIKKAGQLLAENCYESLYTVSHPFTSHLIGLNLKKQYPQLKWVVDIGDPFAFAEEMPLNNFHLYRNVNYRLEKSVFEHADRVAVTNERTSERYVEFFGFHIAEKLCVIGPLVDYSFLDSELGLAKNYYEISLMFAGNLVNPVRKPDIFLSWVFGLLVAWNGREPKMFFDVYGDSALDLQKYLPMEKSLQGLRLHGQVPKADAVYAMKRADILINCGNITDYQLPSKIYEYMATGKPIINFILNPKDPSLYAMKNYPSVFNVLAEANDYNTVIRFIESQIHRPVLKNTDRWTSVLKSHSASSIADRYLEVLR